MRIACPGCAAEYEVPDAALAAGPRMLRCARCQTQFRAALPEATPVAAPVAPAPGGAAGAGGHAPAGADPGPPGRPRPTRGPRRHSPIDPPAENGPAAPSRGRRAGLALAWVLSFAVLAGAGWVALAYRAEVMAAWPPSIRLYQALSLI